MPRGRLRTCLYKEIVIYQCFVFHLRSPHFGFPLLFLNVFALLLYPFCFFLFSFFPSIVAVICCRNNNNSTESKALPNFLSCANEKTRRNDDEFDVPTSYVCPHSRGEDQDIESSIFSLSLCVYATTRTQSIIYSRERE